MRWQNIETPTFAGSAGSAGEPAIVETMQLLDHDGNEVVAFTKAVDGTITNTVDGQPKVYRALLTQTGTDDPVATVLENTLGGTPVWERSTLGTYTLTLTGAFVGQVVPINTSGKFAGDALSAMVGDRTDDNTYTLYTYYSADLTQVSDDVLFNTYVEIPVYP